MLSVCSNNFLSFVEVTYRLKVSSSKSADCKLDATLDADANHEYDAGVFFININ